MPIVIGSAADHAQHGLKLLVYGRPKLGKTVLAASASRVPELAPVLLVDADHGSASLVGQGMGDVTVVTITQAQDLTPIFRFLAEGQKEPLLIGLDEIETPFRTVILDSMTEIHRQCLIHARGAEGMRPGDKLDHTTIRDFGISLDMMLLIVRRFTQLAGQGLNVIYTAREKIIKDGGDAGMIAQIAPALPGQAADELAAYADIVGRLIYKEVVYKEQRKLVRALVLSEFSTTAVSGSRYNVGQVLLEPTMARLMAKLTAAAEGGED